MMGITGAFSSLGINERPRATQDSSGNRRGKNSSTISLPNMKLSERLPIPPKYIRSVCDDEAESSEQPVDFSKKYCESKLIRSEKVLKNGTFSNVVKSYNNSFTMYAETDLDQPTDYSLRYAEDDSDLDRCNKIAKTEAAEFVQDTIKTYCTEDTPYETPFNFSTSTSMSDLRIDEKVPKDETDAKVPEVNVNTKDISNVQTKLKSEFSSGLMSPEKPVNYCEEGTPGYFSRVPSCGSLNSIPVNDPPKQESKETQENTKKEFRRVGKFPSEVKAVKFEEVVNYAEETPLMFSRSSSLASLDSIEQHSIHDDRSSVVSDFSRLTSGVISPSELPDSPSQTIPPSPKPRKTVIIFPNPPEKETEEAPKTAQNVPKSSVFEDVVKKFKVESTPLHFSAATSLSSLIDEDIDKTAGNANGHEEAPEEKNKGLNNLDLSDDSEDEDILAACINIGMQSNRYSHPKTKSPAPHSYNFPDIVNLNNSMVNLKIAPPELPVPVSVNLKTENESLQKTDVTCDSLRTYCTEGTPAVLSHAGSNSDLSVLSMHLNEKVTLSKDILENDKYELLKEINERVDPIQEESSLVEKENVLVIESNGTTRSRRSSFSSLSDDSHESEQALLEECMLAGMPKSNSPNKSTMSVIAGPSHCVDEKVEKNENGIVDDLSDDEDTDILEDCIKIGIENNRYTKTKLNNSPKYTKPKSSPPPKISNDVISDTIKSYCTEDTPAILSNAGSCSNLSILSTQGNENGGNDYFSDFNSNFSDEDEEKLFEECVKHGMTAIAEKMKIEDKKDLTGAARSDLGQNEEAPTSDDDTSISSLSDDSFENEQALLQQCIEAGMPKRSRPPQEDPNDLTPAEKALLQQCILEGMKKCRTVPKKESLEESSDLTEAEQALLRKCILSGMPKNKNLTSGGPSSSRESTELTESERLLLQQCILAGMPKSRSKMFREGGTNRQWVKKPRDLERGGPEHTCCVHCPKNRAARQSGHVKGRRKYKEKSGVQIRESREVNVVYVTSQILTVKKEVVDRTRENWI